MYVTTNTNTTTNILLAYDTNTTNITNQIQINTQLLKILSSISLNSVTFFVLVFV
jgi:hypothetical protein